MIVSALHSWTTRKDIGLCVKYNVTIHPNNPTSVTTYWEKHDPHPQPFAVSLIRSKRLLCPQTKTVSSPSEVVKAVTYPAKLLRILYGRWYKSPPNDTGSLYSPLCEHNYKARKKSWLRPVYTGDFGWDLKRDFAACKLLTIQIAAESPVGYTPQNCASNCRWNHRNNRQCKRAISLANLSCVAFTSSPSPKSN